MNNYERLMPEQVSQWKSDQNQCTFTIQGLATIELQVIRREAFEFILIESGPQTPIHFHMGCHLSQIDETACEAYLDFDGELSMMLEMMVKKPLQNLLDIMADKLATL